MNILTFVAGAFILLMTVTLHELCHGWVAYRLGDDTAKRAGRLTLNPLAHIDPFWTVILPGLLFITTGGRFVIGMAKPVPVDFTQLRRPKRDMIYVALAGPLANIWLAVLLNFFFKFSGNILFLVAIYFNLGLAIFNLIPIPPLDGSRILAGLLPTRWAVRYLRLEPYGFGIVLLLYMSGLLFHLIVPGIDFFCRSLGVPLAGGEF